MKVGKVFAEVFGQRLSLALARRDLSCTDMQRMTGIPWGVISAIKTGHRGPTPEEVHVIVRKAGIPLTELLPEDMDDDNHA